jgi:5-hydroxyisourate hydrolase
MSISTHVLDTSLGRPGAGIAVRLERETTAWTEVSTALTDTDGRATLVARGMGMDAGVYRLTFDAGAYFDRQAVAGFYRRIAIEFVVRDGASHHHVPLLLSPFGYSTYRGS